MFRGPFRRLMRDESKSQQFEGRLLSALQSESRIYG